MKKNDIFVYFQSLTDQLLKMKAWDSELEEEEGEGVEKGSTKGRQGKGEKTGNANLTDTHLQKVQKLIYAAKVCEGSTTFVHADS